MRRHRRWQVYRLGPQYLASVGLPVLASKPGARLMRLDGGDGALMESLRRLRRDEAKLWRRHAPMGIWVVCLMEGCFCHLLGIYILVWVAYLLVRSSDFVCESDLLWLEKGWHGWIFDLIFLPRPIWENSNSKKTTPPTPQKYGACSTDCSAATPKRWWLVVNSLFQSLWFGPHVNPISALLISLL